MIDNVQQKNNSIQGKPEKKASLLLPIIVAAVIFAAMVVSICVSESYRPIDIKDDDFTKCYQIDSLSVENNVMTLNGWCFIYGQDIAIDDNSIVEIALIEINNDKAQPIILDTQYGIQRNDVNDYFLCEYDYTNCGFIASISCSGLDLQNKKYQILIEYIDEKNIFYQTDTYVCENELKYATYEKPSIYESVGGTFINVVNEGYLRVYRPDMGMYVFQYQNNLYWFADRNFRFEDDQSTEIQYQLTTTQIDRIPQKMKDIGAIGDNLSFIFEENEITEISNSGNYRVCTYALPCDYSIKHIVTGYHDGKEWKWQHYFRPRYEF